MPLRSSNVPMIFSQQRRQSPLKAEWRIFFLIMLACATVLGLMNGLGQPDRFIYDALIKSAQRPANEQIVIIAIDNPSITALGRWPWKRTVHAELINRLNQSKAKAIGIDIIFSEPEVQSDGDTRLTHAIASNQRVVLPLLIEHTAQGLQPTLPIPSLMDAAHNVGHTHFVFDADGMVRSILLNETLGDASWPQFSVAVYQTGMRKTPSDRMRVGHDNRELIPFAGPPGHAIKVSYIDVLRGKIPPGYFDGKYVLIGATASGIATMFPTPLTTKERLMPGVEINANVLAGLLEERGIQPATKWLNALVTMSFTCLALFACLYLSPFKALGATLVLIGLIALTNYTLFMLELWVPPAAAILMVISIYPLWNWRRLEATLFYLSEELERLHYNNAMVLRDKSSAVIAQDADFLEKQIAAIRIAGDRARDVHQFVSDSLNNMPDATLVLSQAGELLMCNLKAQLQLAQMGVDYQKPLTLKEIFSHFQAPPRSPIHDQIWYNTLLQTPTCETMEVETRDKSGREFLIKSTASRMADGAMLGWIISLIDVTSLRAAERRREESLNFISHDLRVPQSSILALIQLQKNPSTAFAADEFLNRVEKSVEATLHLAESFVHLAKAESSGYQLQESDFSSMLAEAADNMWAFAHARSVTVEIDTPAEDAWLTVDRSLMIRALGNLLSNAIKFSPEGGRVRCEAQSLMTAEGPTIACSIHDQGPGIAVSKQSMIFSPFLRADDHGQDGIGLGLAFVKMVVERHGGTITLDSTVGKGSTFTIMLPCVADDEEDQVSMNHQEGSKP
ncbi:MAG: CHASE2 domain-containing protein [Oxalicibacterium faecigallinarum]|nr:CHASE2 domain-containing protein [Oxalicibacterium faecigallinarum]